MTKREFMLSIAKDIRKECKNEDIDVTVKVYQDISIEVLCYGNKQKIDIVNKIMKNEIAKKYKHITYNINEKHWEYNNKSYFGFTIL